MPKVVRLPAVWGAGVEGQIGDEQLEVVVQGAVVSRRYRAPRRAVAVDGHGPHRVRVAGSGGHFTDKAHRRRGYNTDLDAAFLADARAAGADLAMLFCLEPLVARNRVLGWRMTHGDDLRVRYTQPDGTWRVCPPHIWVGLVDLSGVVDLATLASLDVEGLPW